MQSTFVLVDFENVQSTEVLALAGEQGELRVFIGPNQHKLPKDVVLSIQKMGARAQYVEVVRAGKNALDFHLAYHLGVLAASNPGAEFIIVSGDGDFDVLIANILEGGVTCRRVAPAKATIADAQATSSVTAGSDSNGKAAAKVAVPSVPNTAPKAMPKVPGSAGSNVVSKSTVASPVAIPKTGKARAKKVVDLLKVMPHPRTVAKLKLVIGSHFSHALADKEVDAIVQSLRDSKVIVVVGEKVTYNL